MNDRLVLCVEDNPGDIRLIQESLHKVNENSSNPPIKMKMFMNGNVASEYLCQISNKEQMPAIILLNLNVPGKNGLELLSEIRKMPHFNQTPVVIHSTVGLGVYSDMFANGANAFIKKAINFEECIDAYAETIDYWLNCHQYYHK